MTKTCTRVAESDIFSPVKHFQKCSRARAHTQFVMSERCSRTDGCCCPNTVKFHYRAFCKSSSKVSFDFCIILLFVCKTNVLLVIFFDHYCAIFIFVFMFILRGSYSVGGASVIVPRTKILQC